MGGITAARAGDWAEAHRLFLAAVTDRPDDAWLRNNLSVAALKLGRPAEAREHLELAFRLQPDSGDIAYHLARTCEALGDLRNALAHYLRAAALLEAAKVYERLGSLLTSLGQYTAAIAAERKALELDPGKLLPLREMANNLCSLGLVNEAQSAWQQLPEIHGEHLLGLHYSELHTPEEIFEVHRRWGATVERQTPALPAPRSARSGPLRIAYVSPDLNKHSVSYFAEALLRHHDRSTATVVCLSDADPARGLPRLASMVEEWHDTRDLSNRSFAAMVRALEIDVLVDLAGHTCPRERLRAFAERPARLHITAIGYPDTTGLARMDYRLTDSITDPSRLSERLHTERLLRCDPCFLCYTPPDDAPEPGSALHEFTFGCFNALPKLSPSLVSAWAQILQRLPESRLLLKCPEFGDAGAVAALRRRFVDLGIAAERVELRPPAPTRAGHLAMYREVDLALDTFPYHGTTTTCEALWMGAPVLTKAGNTHVSRVGLSLLGACGSSEWAVRTWHEYIEAAVGAARRRDELRDQRYSMRERVRRSVLLDGIAYTRRFEGLVVSALEAQTGKPGIKLLSIPSRSNEPMCTRPISTSEPY